MGGIVYTQYKSMYTVQYQCVYQNLKEIGLPQYITLPLYVAYCINKLCIYYS